MALCLMLLAGLAGCGPASTDTVPNLGPNVNVDGTSLSTQDLSLRTDAFTPSTSPVSLASVNGTGAASGTRTPQVGTVPSRGLIDRLRQDT